VNLAARGSRHLEAGVEKIENKNELAEVRGQARSVWIKSFLAAVVLFLFALLLP